MDIIATVFFMLLWSWCLYFGSRSENHDDSTIPLKLSSRWKMVLRLGSPNRELYNLFATISRINVYVYLFVGLLYIVFLRFFIEAKLFFILYLFILFLMCSIFLVKLVDTIIYSLLIRKKHKNAVLNRWLRCVLVDKDGVKDITLFNTRSMNWQKIKAVGIGTVLGRRNRIKPCIYFSTKEITDTHLSYDMADDELFIVDCRKDIVDIILDYAPSEMTLAFSPEWYQDTFTVEEEACGKKPLSIAAEYHRMANMDMNQKNYVRALYWRRKELAIVEATLGKDDRDTAAVYISIGITYECQGLYTKSLEWYLRSYQTIVGHLGKAHQRTIEIKNGMEAVYRNAEFVQPFEDWFTEKEHESRHDQESTEYQPNDKSIDHYKRTQDSERNKSTDSFVVYKSRSTICLVLVLTIIFMILTIISIVFFDDTNEPTASLALTGFFALSLALGIFLCIQSIRWKIKVVNKTIYVTPGIGRVRVATFSEIEKILHAGMGSIAYVKDKKFFTLDGFYCVNLELLFQRLEDENVPYEFKSKKKKK